MVLFIGGHCLLQTNHAQRLLIADDEHRGIAVARDLRLPCFVVLSNLQIQEDGILRTGPFSVTKEITQRIGNQCSCLLIKFNFLNIVGMGADDGIHTLFEHQIPNLFLGFAVGVIVLTAPMQQCNGHIRIVFFDVAQDLCYTLRIYIMVVAGIIAVEQIHALLTAGRQCHIIHALRKRHNCDPQATGIKNVIATGFVKLLTVNKRTHRS